MKKVIACCTLTNTSSVNIYEIRHNFEQEVLVGVNDEDPVWVEIEHDVNGDATFKLGELEISLSDCIRV